MLLRFARGTNEHVEMNKNPKIMEKRQFFYDSIHKCKGFHHSMDKSNNNKLV